MGDAATMMVDVASYGFGYMAERATAANAPRLAAFMDVFAPVFGVVSLLVVTVFVLYSGEPVRLSPGGRRSPVQLCPCWGGA